MPHTLRITSAIVSSVSTCWPVGTYIYIYISLSRSLSLSLSLSPSLPPSLPLSLSFSAYIYIPPAQPAGVQPFGKGRRACTNLCVCVYVCVCVCVRVRECVGCV